MEKIHMDMYFWKKNMDILGKIMNKNVRKKLWIYLRKIRFVLKINFMDMPKFYERVLGQSISFNKTIQKMFIISFYSIVRFF